MGIVNNMENNPLLSIYKMMKAKGILTKGNPEYEAMISEEQQEKKHSEEFDKWHNNLSLQEQKDFDFVFGK